MSVFQKLISWSCIWMLAALPAQAAPASLESTVRHFDRAMERASNSLERQIEIDRFAARIAELQRSGVSQSELIQALGSLIQDARLASDLRMLSQISAQRGSNPEQTAQLVARYLENSRQTGAAWSDQATYAVISIAVIAVIIVVLASQGSSSSTHPGYFDELPICPAYACAAPPEGCNYTAGYDSNGCMTCGTLVCNGSPAEF